MTQPDQLDSSARHRAITLTRAGRPDVELNRRLLREFCEIARRQRVPETPFPVETLALLVEALEDYLDGTSGRNLEALLGLSRRGKPPDPQLAARNAALQREVARLLALTGDTLTENRDEAGIFVQVAESVGAPVTEAIVKEAWYALSPEERLSAELTAKLDLEDKA